MDTSEKRRKQCELIERLFRDIHWRMFGLQCNKIDVYEAPAAESWVVIFNDQAWVAASDREEFVFWGPLGKKPVSFNIPEKWPT